MECRLVLHYSYTFNRKASNYGIFCFNNKIKVNVKNILLNSVAVVFVTLSYYFNITILNVAALVIACIYAVGINWKLIKMFFAEIRKYKKEGN